MSGPSLRDPAGRKRILAASSPGLAALLNVLPGLGAGYIYQRRWRPYWLNAALASLALWLDGLLGSPAAAEWEVGKAIPALAPLLGLALVTAGEAFLAARRARMT